MIRFRNFAMYIIRMIQWLIRKSLLRRTNGYPKIVYKYRDWSSENHRSMLRDNKAYLASPKDFNDPFDCRISKNYTSLNTDRKIWEYIEMWAKEFNESPHYPNITQEKKNEIYGRLKNSMPEFQAQAEKGQFESEDKCFGILSLSARWDSILMWGHYANSHKGFCIGLYTEELRETGQIGKGGYVNYSDEFPNINPRTKQSDLNAFISESFKQTHTKAKDWQYEKEFRLQSTIFPGGFSKEDRIIDLPDSCFAEVLIGLNCPDDHKKDIIRYSKEKKIPVYQIVKVPFKFKLERRLIN